MAFQVRRGSIVWLLVLASACATPASPTEVGTDADAGATASSDVATSLVQLTNSERSTAGLAAMRANTRLMQAAQLHADQMARMDKLAHELSGAQYPRPQDRLAAAGYLWQAYAENIAMGQSTAAAAMDGWMHSSGHRANILNPSLAEIGIGFAHNSAGRPYYVQVFGTPR
ncbi:MAG TPA: CAP domain-containing protein [Vicinamibacterales bacterium]|nr:CAP domain-containing protein [Vicinamibacterales bacterium]